jgi:hypothetical protein
MIELNWLTRRWPRLLLWKWSPWRRWFLRVVGGAAVVLVLTGLVWLGLKFDLGKSDWAAWVQAVGSIAAIAGAWVIGKRQSDTAYLHAMRLQENDRHNRVLAVFPIAARAHELIVELDNMPYDHYYKGHYSAPSFRACIKAIEAIPLHELGKFGLVEGYMQMQQALEAAAHAAAKRLELGESRYARGKAERASDADVAEARRKADAALSLINSSQIREPIE